MRLSWIINRTSASESAEDPLGVSLGFLADLLDFLAAMGVVDDKLFHGSELGTVKGEGRDMFSSKPL